MFDKILCNRFYIEKDYNKKIRIIYWGSYGIGWCDYIIEDNVPELYDELINIFIKYNVVIEETEYNRRFYFTNWQDARRCRKELNEGLAVILKLMDN